MIKLMSWYVLLHSYKLFAFTTVESAGVSQAVSMFLILRLVIQPSLVILTCHSWFLGSLHPQRMISLLKETSQPVLWKYTLHPLLHRAATERRLLMSLRRQWAMHALGGSFWRSRLIVCLMQMRVPPGWATFINLGAWQCRGFGCQ